MELWAGEEYETIWRGIWPKVVQSGITEWEWYHRTHHIAGAQQPEPKITTSSPSQNHRSTAVSYSSKGYCLPDYDIPSLHVWLRDSLSALPTSYHRRIALRSPSGSQ